MWYNTNMKKLNTSPLSGMQELIPAEQAAFNQLKENIRGVYHHHGFLEIETPVIDRTEILLAKAGGDTEKQVYLVNKPAEVAEDANQALRFDHTVPLARYVVEHENDIAFPFRVTQIARNFRGERPQKGRFREFYQCDVDIIGRGTLPIAYDAEAIATVYEALETFKLPNMKIRISNRKILSGFIASLGLSDKTAQISDIIDHAEKVPEEKTVEALKEEGLSNEAVAKILAFTKINGNASAIKPQLDALAVDNPEFTEGVDELLTVLDLLDQKGLGDTAMADLLIVRGLDYYTGTVAETFLPEYRQIGSIASGGRYENLASNFTEQSFPGVGMSIGLTRLFFILNEYGLLATKIENPIDLAIIPISSHEYRYCNELAAKLHAQGLSTDINFTDRKLTDKLTHASKIAKAGVVIGGEETAGVEPKVKIFATGAQISLTDYLKA